jgi:hypothetical protein
MNGIDEFKFLYCVPKNLTLRDYQACPESQEYAASSFKLDEKLIHFRCAKITPTKIGQFVTFWKRDAQGITQPHDQHDQFDSLMVYVKSQNRVGLFIFPKQVLIQHAIISSNGVEGKRGFRVYPAWDITDNKQATKTQAWQIKYFQLLS